MISVIVPVYNVDRYLDKCMRSLLDQTFSGSYEIILVDDGSTDLSGQLCDRYGSENENVLVLHQKNAGLSAARNAGIAKAGGEYITFVDSDDYVSADYLEVLYTLLLKYDADISVIEHERVYDGNDAGDQATEERKKKRKQESEAGETVEVYDAQKALHELFHDKIPTASWGKLFKKSVVSDEFFPPGRIYEDFATTYRSFGEAKRVVYSDRIGYYYLQHKNSLIHTGTTGKKIEDFMHAKEGMEEYVRRYYPQLQDASKVFSLVYSKSLFTNLCDGSKVSRENYRLLKSQLKGFLLPCIKDREADKKLKIRMFCIWLGYGPMRMFQKMADGMNRGEGNLRR